MNNSDMLLVFDLLEVGFKDWSFPAFGLIFVAIGFIMVRFSRRAMELFNATNRPRFYKFFSRFFLGFAIFWTVTAFLGIYGSYLSLRDAYLDGNFELVEGPVENFEPMPKSGHADERFTVSGQEFSYSDFNISPGYNNTRSHGSPVGAGVYVRIFHVRGKIVRLEVEQAAVEAAAATLSSSSQQSIEHSLNFQEGSAADKISRYFWIMMIVVILANAGIWRWRGRTHIARDPSLREGYNRLTTGAALWASVPVVVGGVTATVTDTNLFEVLGPSSGWSALSAVYHLAWGIVVTKWAYWTYFQDGAAKMARHPGLIDHEWVAKLWPGLVVAGLLVSVAASVF